MSSTLSSGDDSDLELSTKDNFEQVAIENGIGSISSNPDSFITKWNTTMIGFTESNEIQLPLLATGSYNFLVDWGDGTSDTIVVWNTAVHTYTLEGIYTVNITGQLNGWSFANQNDKLKLIELVQWGNISLGNDGGYFYGCNNMVITASDVPDLTGTTDMTNAFRDTYNLGSPDSIGSWDVSNVTIMSSMFEYAKNFNSPIQTWDVSNVTTMERMFFGADAFNQSIDGWDVSSVTNMVETFYSADSFNQPLNSWDVSKVVDMNFMFSHAVSFNQPLDNWDVSNVQFMEELFYDATSFDQDLGDWNITSVTSDFTYFLVGPRISAANYDSLLLGWSGLNLQSGNSFDAPTSFYSSEGASARQSIIDTFLWTFNDAGVDNTSPDIDSPKDQLFGVGTTGQSIVWTVGDINTDTYDLYIDESLDQSKVPWVNGTVTINLDGIGAGVHNFTLVVSDLARYQSSDTVVVYVDDLTSPSIDSPSDINFEENSIGNNITWMVGDQNPLSYDLYVNGIVNQSIIPWVNGSIVVNLNGLTYGSYNFTIVVSDQFGRSVTDTVIVNAQDSIAPSISSPSDIEYFFGDEGNEISWVIGDKHPDVITGTLNDLSYQSSITWVNGTFTLNVDGLEVGVYNLTIKVFDKAGNLSTDSVIITVKEILNTSESSQTTVSSKDSFLVLESDIILVSLLGIIGLKSYQQRNERKRQ